MDASTKEEITEKLVQLKQYSREYDAQRKKMLYSSGKQVDEAYQAMLEAEKHYLALSDWFIEQRIPVFWDCEQQKYIALPPLPTQ